MARPGWRMEGARITSAELVWGKIFLKNCLRMCVSRPQNGITLLKEIYFDRTNISTEIRACR